MADETGTYVTKARTMCPFYGFSYEIIMRTFSDSKGNQCALNLYTEVIEMGKKKIVLYYSPCRMEMEGQEVSWDNCSFFNKEENYEGIEKLLESAAIFPNELRPEGASLWAGIPFREWYEHIVNGKEI